MEIAHVLELDDEVGAMDASSELIMNRLTGARVVLFEARTNVSVCQPGWITTSRYSSCQMRTALRAA